MLNDEYTLFMITENKFPAFLLMDNGCMTTA